MAQTPEELVRRRRRRRLMRGLLAGAAAIGLPALANAILARRATRLAVPVWGTAQSVPWGGSRVSYRRLGQGEPILLLHSMGPGHSSLEWWQAAELLARRWKVLVPDLPGWGESPRPPAPLDSGLYCSWLVDFLAGVVQRPATVVATGRSAAYALAVAARRPGLIRALGLVVPRGLRLAGDRPDVEDRVVLRLLGLPVLGTSALNLYTSRSSLERYLRRDVYCDPAQVTREMVDHHYRAAHLPGNQAALAALLGGRLELDAEPLLGEVRQPVWIAWGRAAASPAVETADLWLHRIPDAQLEVFSGAALLPHAETPRLFCTAFERFAAATPRRDTAS
jgi:pimeloyl-ACP methyl ester carboxylesterase